MRFLIVISFLLVFARNNTGSKKVVKEIKPAVEENMKTLALELAVQGMTCTGCEQTIQSGIGSLKGIKQVKADFKTGKAYVEYIPEMADTNSMKEKITSSGYVVAGIKAIPLDTLRSKL
jgi:copper chaperone CopZ